MTDVKILQGRLILETANGGLIEVKPFARTHLIKYMGYYDRNKAASGEDPYIYIYRGKLKNSSIKVPGSIYKTKSGNIIWVAHEAEKAEKYHLSNCKELSKEMIAKQLEKPDIKVNQINPELLDGMDGEIFAPSIRDSDDALKRIVKTTLQHMKLDLKTLKSKFNNDYDLNNLKSQLIKEGAMSSKYFARWVEVLDIDIEVIIRNKPGFNRLHDEVTIILK